MDNDQYELGKNHGFSDEEPMSGFLMSQRTHSYTIGYLAGYAMNVMSMQGGSDELAAHLLGKLAMQYNITADAIDDHVIDDIFKTEGGFTDELRSEFNEGFSDKLRELTEEED
ncbi:hypothetical protein QNF07_002339 [Vibrio alginolyticus]|uniref:hypothetical protein n=1 Tax=Vibrio alginolyticus TaxID=663 RepID=UPI0013038EF5|nr:hypothetical protein [Vibrio alginolyticus]EJN8561168.1 hypothetical protein [Vibrio alginolyticus]EKY4205015.1 hypothetical protein [Vibrio alginolyticus]ELB2754057.1 hypothetical protein [Vibrio alginolyticus]